jgi:Ca-activated chloride channel family protein
LIDLIQQKAQTGVYLTVLGFGMGNYRDGTLKQLAAKGNGNYGYIDTIEEANKVLVQQMSGTLVTIANDVKIQVEFNPATVGAYRLIGYENRLLRAEDFNNDTVDAGDIGAGHTVTAFYELIPPGAEADSMPSVDPLKYTAAPEHDPESSPVPEYTDEFLTVKIRYKLPKSNTSELISFPVRTESVQSAGTVSDDFVFAASVAAFGMILRDSPYKGTADLAAVYSMAERSAGQDRFGYRAGFLRLIQAAQRLIR